MVSLNALTDAVKKGNPQADLNLIGKAYAFSEKAHTGQKRKSGEPYFSHPTEVALILARHGMDLESVVTGLLHDVVEDTLVSLPEVEKEFGPGVAHLVDGVTKLSKVSFASKDVRQAESFRKMLLAMAADIRVIIVKLADRLHNMRTLEPMEEMRQIAIAKETLEIYAPLANRMGIGWLKAELEDLSLKYLKHNVFIKLEEQLKATAPQRDQYISRVIRLIGDKMQAENIPPEVTGRVKHLYSIFRKMETRSLDFEQVADVLAFRIIVNDLSQCYEALGHIHSLWKPVPGRFKDYIALPKGNMYQSLHTTVIGPEGRRIEIQIRTRQMHLMAEEGVASHWLYKDGELKNKSDFDRFRWLRHLVEWQQDLKDSHEFIETVKIDLFADEVYVFTPKGEVYEFPRGSTPIDFAYRIHSEVGHHCTRAKVNGRIVPLKYRLQNGDTVEIITSDMAKPTKDWLKLVVTSKAKSKIRGVIKKEERETGRAVGHGFLDRELKKYGETYDRVHKTGRLGKIAEELGYDSLDDLLLAVGYGKLTTSDVLSQLLPAEKLDHRQAPGTIRSIVSRVLPRKFSPIKVGGIGDVMVRYGKCCDPLPGDAILGFVTRGRGVTVHRTDCYKILEVDSARKIDVEWDKTGKAVRSVRIKVVSLNAPGILADISKAITQKGGNISHASIQTTFDRKAINTFDVEVTDTSQLHSLMRSIEKIRGIISVERVKA
ncbi:MAG: bifunctional (p)ppGpp synthetase/guanosine-3',5'-bis(diphosphate) 3'-pyrophosphohydrolase [Pseudomonadota bacterium]